MVHELQLLVLQGVKITNNERELENKQKEEEDIVREIERMPDESEDGADQVKDLDLRQDMFALHAGLNLCHLASACIARFLS